MADALPIDHLTLEEKILTMESLWDDLCKRAGDDLSPPWHEALLQEREEYGSRDPFIDWEVAKKQIRDSL